MAEASWVLLNEEEGADLTAHTLITENGFIKICRENVSRVNAMIKTNSTYRNSANEKAYPSIKKSKLYNGELFQDGNYYKENNQNEIYEIIDSDNDNFNYIGSSAFWFSALKVFFDNEDISNKKDITISKDQDEPLSFGYVLYKTICAVDSENSTHLNADGIGRALLSRRLYEMAKSKELYNSLKNPNKYQIIEKLSERGKKQKGTINNRNPRYNLSFATKWCHYACMYMFKKEARYRDNFAIVDGVMKKSLKKYEDALNKDKCKDLDFSILEDTTASKKKPKVTANEKIGTNYDKYIAIVDAVRTSGENEISRNGLDHLLWYGNKGLFSDDEDDSDD